MQLSHEFTVPAPLDEVWSALLDPERVAPCMPGATLSSVEGNTFRGSVKVKLGPVSLLYKGSGEYVETDEAARRVVISASGKDARGNGTASAKVTVTLRESDGGVTGAVETDLNVTGKPAQFGRGMISEVSGKILSSFADCLAGKLGHQPEPAAASESTSSTAGSAGSSATSSGSGSTESSAGGAHRASASGSSSSGSGSSESSGSSAEAIDIMQFASGSVAKRLGPVLAAVLVAAVLFVVLRRRKQDSADDDDRKRRDGKGKDAKGKDKGRRK